MDDTIHLYTDGGCAPNPGTGGWAAVLLWRDKTRHISGGELDTTNNRMELLAAVQGLSAITRPSTVIVYTDSQYLSNGMTQWVKGWIKNNWTRKVKGVGYEPVKNAELWQQLVELCRTHTVSWQWVKAHNGNHYNEMCDKLAAAEIQKLIGKATPRPTVLA